MSPRRTAADWALLVTLILLWGTSFLVTRIAVASVPPTTLVAVRVGIAAITLGLIVKAAGLRLPALGPIWWHFLALAVVGNALPFFLISWGQERIDSGVAGILMAVMPLATLVLAHFLVPDDRMTLAKTTGFLLGFAGVLTLTGPAAAGRIGSGGSDLWRQLAVLAGALCYAFNTIIARRLPPIHVLVVTASVMIVGAAVMIPVSIAVDSPWGIAADPSSIIAAVWLGFVSTAAANVVYFRLIASAGPTFLSMINYPIPLVAVAAGVLVLGEKPDRSALVALALILTGLALSGGVRTRSSPPDEEARRPPRSTGRDR